MVYFCPVEFVTTSTSRVLLAERLIRLTQFIPIDCLAKKSAQIQLHSAIFG